jgi:hypothetical protein
MRLLHLLLLPLATTTAAAQEWQVRGRVAGDGPAFPGALVSIPALRAGTIAGELGRFVLRASGPAQCYELILRAAEARTTHYRFLAPSQGELDLGDIWIRPRYPRISDTVVRVLPELIRPLVPKREARDTMGTCLPSTVAAPESWPAARALVVGRMTRGGRPLRGVSLGFHCGYLEPFVQPDTRTDSTGSFRFDALLAFPQDQMLADSGQAQCTVRIVGESIDTALTPIVSFGPASANPPLTRIDWRLPDPILRAVRVVGMVTDRAQPLTIPGIAALSPGVFPRPQVISLAIVSRPDSIVTPQYPGGRPPGQLLPMAIRVSTGRQVPTTGSYIYVLVPRRIAESITPRGGVRAFVRVPRDGNRDEDVYLELGVTYDASLGQLRFTLVDRHFSDLRNSANMYEAVVVMTVVP